MKSRGAIYCRADDRQEVGRPVLLEEKEESAKPFEAIRCKKCGRAITTQQEKIAVSGSFTHTFFNPAGIVFELGCFRRATGSMVIGEATLEFTWFAGHLWRFALCAGCRTHLGWHYENGDGTSSFFGLILAQLVE